MAKQANPKAGQKEELMWNIAVILIFLWSLGMVKNYTMGGFIHILPVIAVYLVLVCIVQGGKFVRSK